MLLVGPSLVFLFERRFPQRQHQYEDTYYEAGGEWRFELAALQASSYLALPRPLAWVVGNANYHHVHHLSARIPNYRLRAAHEEQPMFARTPVVTVRAGIAALGLKLWDEKSGSLVPFGARPRGRVGRQKAVVHLRAVEVGHRPHRESAESRIAGASRHSVVGASEAGARRSATHERWRSSASSTCR
jgi:hypothetical protein